ncbi:MAG: hypothetical protein RR906_07680 [Acetivibrio sp.]
MKSRKIAAIALVLFLGISGTGTWIFAAEENKTEEVSPSGMVLREDDTMLVTDMYSKTILTYKNYKYTRLTGTTDIIGIDGEPVGGYRDGTLEEALFESPWAIVPYKEGYAITDTENNTLRFLDEKNETVSTIAGNIESGLANGKLEETRFNRPTGLAKDEKGNLYIADTGNHIIRKMDVEGKVTTYAGSKKGCRIGDLLKTRLKEPTGLYYYGGALYVADSGNHRILKMKDGKVTKVAGTTYKRSSDGFYEGGYKDGKIKIAEFSNPQGIAVTKGIVYVADTGNSVIRKIEKGKVTTIKEREGTESMYPVSPRSIFIKKKELMVSDVFAKTIFTVNVKERRNESK